MTVDRRTFLAGAALVAVAPGVKMSAQKIQKQPANTRRIAFMIDGWSTQDPGPRANGFRPYACFEPTGIRS